MAEVDADGKSMIVVNRPRLPFEILIHVKPPFDYKFPATDEVYSYVGLKLKMKRKDLDQLLAGYFVPTGIFALLSVLSFFVPPEQVIHDVIQNRKCLTPGLVSSRSLEEWDCW